MIRKSMVAAAAALTVVSSAAYAAVAFDPVSGTGFVGKGDVQFAFGWNNKQAQDNAKAVAFSLQAQDKYDVTCEWTTQTGGPNSKTIFHDVEVKRVVNVNNAVAYDARQKNQYTGYNLTGFGATSTNGTVPVLGGSCPQAHATAVITEVTQTSSTGGNLSVTWGGLTVELPNTPVL